MRVSLVTPSYEQAALLRACLASIARLDPAVEHVVADGASTDGSVDLLRAAGVAFVSEPDRGMYEALNRGFARTSGDVLGYVNCDDALWPWTPTVVLEAFAARPDVDIVYGDSVQLRDDRASFTVVPPAAALDAWFAAGGVLAQPAVFFRRAVYERLGGFDDSYRFMGDVDFFVRARRAGVRFAKVWEALAVERMSPQQLTARFRSDVDDERRRAFGWTGAPRHARDAAWRGAAAILHRSAVSTWFADALGGRAAQSLPWPRLRASGFVAATSRRALWRALARPSASTTYAALTEAGRRCL